VTNGNRTIIDLPKMPKLPAGGTQLVLLSVVAPSLVASSFYQVDPEEVGVVRRFGKFSTTTEPGLHFVLPFGVDRVIKVPVQRQLEQECGFRTVSAGVRSEFRPAQGESNTLTGDLNAAVVEWVVQYRVNDPYNYLFRVGDVSNTLRDLSEAVMRQVVGDRTVDEVLTVGRAEVAELAQVELQRLCDQYETGIKIEQVVLQDVTPPDPVKPSFNEVNRAKQDKERIINEARRAYNKAKPEAEGQANQMVSEAEGYKIERVNRAEGDAERFLAMYEEYRVAKDVTRRRLYLETMADVLPRINDKVVVDEKLEGLLPLLQLGGGSNTVPPKGGGR